MPVARVRDFAGGGSFPLSKENPFAAWIGLFVATKEKVRTVANAGELT